MMTVEDEWSATTLHQPSQLYMELRLAMYKIVHILLDANKHTYQFTSRS